MTELTSFDVMAQKVTSRIPVILIGGFAINFYKVGRATQDVDFMIQESDFQTAFKALEEEGFKLRDLKEAFARLKSPHHALMDIDFMFVDKNTFNEINKNAVKTSINGHEFLVPKLDHLIALKLHALKSNYKERWTKDLPDIIKLITANAVDPKADSFKSLCLKYGTPDVYKKIMEGF